VAFPASVDAFTTKTDHVSQVNAADVNALQTAVVAIETALLTTPIALHGTTVAADSGMSINTGGVLAGNTFLSVWGPNDANSWAGMQVVKNGVSALYFRMRPGVGTAVLEFWDGTNPFFAVDSVTKTVTTYGAVTMGGRYLTINDPVVSADFGLKLVPLAGSAFTDPIDWLYNSSSGTAFEVFNETSGFHLLDLSTVGDFQVRRGGAFWGHAVVGAQPAAPVTLADVIAIIRGCGLSA
jgi:hypothetical protein